MASPAQEPTLVGLCDGELDVTRYRSTFLTNKVGGRPDWPPVLPRPSPRCARCGAPSAHVVQVYCPLEASPYHRTLHLFACLAAGCGSESWTVLRSQCLEAEAAPRTPGPPLPAQEAPLAATDWCEGADDWGVEGGEDAWGGGGGVPEDRGAPRETACNGGDADVGARLQDLHLDEDEDGAPVLRPLFISVVEEEDLGGDDAELQHAQQLLREYERREGVAAGELQGGGGGGGEEKYEKTRARHGDAAFSRFMKKISLCPQQILRYCRGGTPLFISSPPCGAAAVQAAACSSCGGGRTFELQLMPALVGLLRRTDGAEAELEFGTVLVYTCANSCWTAGSRSAMEEFCWVQPDPDQQLFR